VSPRRARAKPKPAGPGHVAARDAEIEVEARAADADGEDEREVEIEIVPDDEPAAIAAKAEPVKAPGDAASDGPAAESADAEDKAGALVAFDPLQRYLTEIRRYPLLTREEEHELAVRFQASQDVEAAYKLVTGNLRLVVMIAREYQRSFRNLLDLVQEGNIGLMEAVKNFDPYRGVRFPSYAVWWIRAYIIRYVINNWRMVKLGTTQAQRKLFFNLQKEKEKLEREGFVAAPKLLADRLGVKEKEIIEMQQRLGASDLSVDSPLRDGEDSTMLDVLQSGADTAEEAVADAEFRALVGQRIREFGRTLKDKDRVIFDHRLLAEDPLTLQDIGDRYGISRERVRQIENRVKRKLKAYLEEQFPDLHGVDLTFV
jgi:RNA polymerase sigma-32 factor